MFNGFKWLILFFLISASVFSEVVDIADYPQFPQGTYDAEKIEAFIDPEQLEILYQLSEWQAEYSESNRDIHPRYKIGFWLNPGHENTGLGPKKYKVIGNTYLASLIEPGVYELTEPSWLISPSALVDESGHVRAINLVNFSKGDLAVVARLSFVETVILRYSYSIEGMPNRSSDVDFSHLNGALIKSLRSTAMSNKQLASAVCTMPKIEQLVFPPAGRSGEFDLILNDCDIDLKFISVIAGGPQTFIDNIELENLNDLEYVDFGDVETQNLILGGEALPKLESIDLRRTSISEEVSGFSELPALKQLILKEVSSTAYQTLELPESLEFLSLNSAQLQDYSFVGTAKKLKSLDLSNSGFDQWSLLSELTELEHLDITGLALTDEAVQEISKLENLQSLFMWETPVLNLRPLEALTGLNSLGVPDALNDLDYLPYIPKLSYLTIGDGLANSQNWPERLLPYFDEVGAERAGQCLHDKPCSQVPFFYRNLDN